MEEIIKIPGERVKVLIGDNESTKKMLEKKCNIRIDATPDGEVTLRGDTADVYFSKSVITAIGRGFDPNTAIKLLEADYQLHIFYLKEYLSSENAIKRIKGRVIGEKGRTKAEIESATDSSISVYGNTIAIIGKADSIDYAKEAIERLIRGATHTGVYRYLADVRRRLFEERLRGV
ncbi:MAG: KH domain-containing protein [Candidatus Bilamarchaeaceae archaeon]